MTIRPTESFPPPMARVAGGLYLLYFCTAVAGGLLMKGLVVPAAAAATAENVLAHETLYRAGLGVGLLATALYIVLSAVFYFLFKPAGKRVSLAAAFFGLAGCAVQAAGSVLQLAPLVLLGGHQTSTGFTPEQVQTLASWALQLHGQCTSIELVFFAFYDLFIGYLIWRSTFLPKTFGGLMMLAGAAWLSAIYPPLLATLSPWVEVAGFVAELALMSWLLAMGVNVARWHEQANREC